MGRPVVHWEMWSNEPSKVSDFYSKVFDWNVRHIPEMDYHLVETGGDGGINGGIMKPQNEHLAGKMVFYIDVDDLDSYVKRVADAGGKIVVEKMEVPGVGLFSMFEDPDGRLIGIWKQKDPSE